MYVCITVVLVLQKAFAYAMIICSHSPHDCPLHTSFSMLIWCIACWWEGVPEKYGREPEKLFAPSDTCLKDVEAPMEIGMLPVSRTQILTPLLATLA